MKPRFFIIVLVTFCALASCSDPSSPDGDLRGLSVRITTDRSVIRPGDSVLVRFVLKNESTETFAFSNDPRVPCPISIEIRAPFGINYYRGMNTCGPNTQFPVVLAPRDSLVGAGWWPGITYVSAAQDVAGVTGPAPAGTYHAVATVWWDLRHVTLSRDSVRIAVQP